MKVVSVINYKGGVGKTTLTANLGAYAASKGKRVLFIDIDPQTHLTFNFISVNSWEKNYADNKTMRDFFKPIINGNNDTTPLSQLIIPITLNAGVNRYDAGLISSHLELIDTESELSAMILANTPTLFASTFLKTFTYFQKALSEVQNQYDLVLIDCPPNFYIMVRNAILASDYYIVPSKLDYFSKLGIENLEKNIEKLLKKYNNNQKILEGHDYPSVDLKMLGIVPMMVNHNKGEKLIDVEEEYKKDIEKKRRYYLFQSVRNSNAVFNNAPTIGIPVVLTQPAFFKSTQKTIVKELEALGDDFLKKVINEDKTEKRKGDKK